MSNATSTASYEYDGFNRRVAKTVNGTKTYYVSDGDNEIEERTAAGALTADYVYGNAIDEVLTMSRGGNTYYYHYDGLGSVTDLTNSAGASQESYDYDVYGQATIRNAAGTVIATSVVGNPFFFTGRRLDPESGIYYYRARMYDPTIGRFLQRDPLEYEDSLNLYTYVNNDPINWVDPLGLSGELSGFPVMLPVMPVSEVPDGQRVEVPLPPVPTFPMPSSGQGNAPQGNGQTCSIEGQNPNEVKPKYGNPDENVDRGHRKKRGKRGGSKWNDHTKKRPGDSEKGDRRRGKSVKDKKKKKQ